MEASSYNFIYAGFVPVLRRESHFTKFWILGSKFLKICLYSKEKSTLDVGYVYSEEWVLSDVVLWG